MVMVVQLLLQLLADNWSSKWCSVVIFVGVVVADDDGGDDGSMMIALMLSHHWTTPLSIGAIGTWCTRYQLHICHCTL